MKNNNEVIKVSDWSQKYKLAIYAISGIGMTIAGYKIWVVLNEIKLLLEKLV